MLVLFYTTAIEDEQQRMIATRMDELAQKFKQMNINTVGIASYDVNVENQPPRIEN